MRAQAPKQQQHHIYLIHVEQIHTHTHLLHTKWQYNKRPWCCTYKFDLHAYYMGIKLIKSSIEFCGKLKHERQWWWRRWRRWPAQHIEQRTKGERMEFVALFFWFALFIFLRCCFFWLLFYRYYAIKLQSTLMPVDIRNYFVWIKKINRLMICFVFHLFFCFLFSISPFLSSTIDPCAYDFNNDCLIPRNRYIHYRYLDMPIRVGIEIHPNAFEIWFIWSFCLSSSISVYHIVYLRLSFSAVNCW